MGFHRCEVSKMVKFTDPVSGIVAAGVGRVPGECCPSVLEETRHTTLCLQLAILHVHLGFAKRWISGKCSHPITHVHVCL